MKEYTLIYNAEITDIIKTEDDYELPEHFTNRKDVADWIKEKLEVDDVHVKNVKVFERDL